MYRPRDSRCQPVTKLVNPGLRASNCRDRIRVQLGMKQELWAELKGIQCWHCLAPHIQEVSPSFPILSLGRAYLWQD
ncbi:Hemoglobin Subunit Mu [Manis pentadactyla]|nr:Hemoglobin Subunit Mu [Manis pentadactyla]